MKSYNVITKGVGRTILVKGATNIRLNPQWVLTKACEENFLFRQCEKTCTCTCFIEASNFINHFFKMF